MPLNTWLVLQIVAAIAVIGGGIAGVVLGPRTRGLTRRHGRLFTAYALLAFVVVYGTAASLRYEHFHIDPWDITIYDQVLYNWAFHGTPVSTLHMEHQFVMHLAWIQGLMAVLMGLLPSTHLLLWSHVLAIAAAFIPIMLLAEDLLDDPRWTMALAWGWVWLPMTTYNTLDYHPVVFAMPFQGLAFWYIHRSRYGLASLMLAGTLLMKEEMGVFIAMVGVSILLAKRRWTWGTLFLLGGAGYTLFAVKVGMPWFNDGQDYVHGVFRYASLGGTLFKVAISPIRFPEVIIDRVFVFPPNREYLLALPFVYGGGILFSPVHWIILFPTFMQNALVDGFSSTRHLADHAQVPMIVTGYVATIHGWARLGRWWQRRGPSRPAVTHAVGGMARWMVMVPPVALTLMTSLTPLNLYSGLHPITDRQRRADAQPVVDYLLTHDRGSLVAAHESLLPHLVAFPRLTWWPTAYQPDLVVVSVMLGYGTHDIGAFHENLRVLDGNYGLAFFSGPYAVLERGREPTLSYAELAAGMARLVDGYNGDSRLRDWEPPAVREDLGVPVLRLEYSTFGGARYPRLMWEAIPEARLYEIDQVEIFDQRMTLRKLVGTTSWTDLAPVKPGRWQRPVIKVRRVRAIDAEGNVSPWSEPLTYPVGEHTFPTLTEFFEKHGGVIPPRPE